MGHEMLAYSSARYYTGHCTGQRAFRVLKVFDMVGDDWRVAEFTAASDRE